MFDNECPLREAETDAAVDGRAADPSVWLVRPGARGRRSSEKRGGVREGTLHREPSRIWGGGTYQAGTSIWHTCVDHGTSSRGLLQQVSLGGGEHGARDLSTGVGGVGPAR